MTREFIYMPTFEKQWKEAKLNDNDLRDLEAALCEHPDKGNLIQETGGLRKLRWNIPGKGKRGGMRILYVDFADFGQIFMITCFKKAKQENLSNAEKNQIRTLIDEIKTNLREKGS